MSLGPVIDVAIGLIFVYLLLGLAVTASQEALAGWLSLRGIALRTEIARIVADGDQTAGLFRDIFDHPLVGGTRSTGLPSYVPSRNFALALIDVLGSDRQAPVFTQFERAVAMLPAGSLRESLIVFVRDSEGDLDALKTKIATWYDDCMDRLSGVYKRYSQAFAIALSLVVAIVLNVDSLHIAQALWQNESLRANVVAAADAYSAVHKSPSSSGSASDATASCSNDKSCAASAQLDDAIAGLTALALPIGWSPPPDKKATCTTTGFSYWLCSARATYQAVGFGGALLTILGWLITALAASLGAPFWFDLLQNVLNLRNAGPKPQRSDAQGSKP